MPAQDVPSTSGGALYDDVMQTAPPWGSLGRQAVLGVVALTGKAILDAANTTVVSGRERFERMISDRDRTSGEGLVTVCNHASTFDDPGVLSSLIPWSFFMGESAHAGVRWTLCADEICAKNSLREAFFLCGKALPIKRGGGVEQPAMRTAANLLARGDWVHVFPEGRVSKNGELGGMRRGLAKLLCDVEMSGGKRPIILPFFHSGMEHVKPYGKWQINVGNRVHVTVGEPLYLSDLTRQCARCEKNAKARDHLHTEIMRRIEKSLKDLERQNARERASPT